MVAPVASVKIRDAEPDGYAVPVALPLESTLRPHRTAVWKWKGGRPPVTTI
jgi:hypothetical protein